MSYIEGIGDEVTVAFGALLLVLSLVLAWVSTYVADRSDQLLGAIITVANSPVVGLGVDRYVSSSASASTSEPQAGLEDTEDKSEEEDNVSDSGLQSNNLQGEQASGGSMSDSSLDHFLNIQGLHKRTVPSSEPQLADRTATEASHGTADLVNLSVARSEPDVRPIKVRLKFLNDTEEIAIVKPDDTIGFVKSKYFPGQEQQMKFIYQGQLLQDQGRTLGSLNITDNCVIHCHVSPVIPAATNDGAPNTSSNGVSINVGNLMIPVLVFMLAAMWYFRINYRHFFTAPATISLVGITVFFSFLVFGMYGR